MRSVDLSPLTVALHVAVVPEKVRLGLADGIRVGPAAWAARDNAKTKTSIIANILFRMIITSFLGFYFL